MTRSTSLRSLSLRSLSCALVCLLAVAVPSTTLAGTGLETLDITGNVPSPIPGEIVADVVPVRWDERCIPVQFRLNDSLDPIPNPLGDAFLALDDARAALETAMGSWNDVPTSFIEMGFVGTSSNPGLAGFDMVNEQTFQFPPELSIPGTTAVTAVTALMQDSHLADGDDLDSDGDSDVSSALSVCGDVDSDGDIEFPAGFYEAGTILDADVQFNSLFYRYTVETADIDNVSRSADLEGVAVHELGHAHGLADTPLNMLSDTDGTGASMFETIDVSDPDNELSQRSLEVHDRATSSLFYPEGTAYSGPAALSPGDVPFRHVYGVIKGEATHGDTGRPLVGAAVQADRFFDGRAVVSALTGSARVSFDPVTETTSPVDPDFAFKDGKYVLPVPFGLYSIGIQALDMTPIPAVPGNTINLSHGISFGFGQQDFNEEFYNGFRERAIERNAAARHPILGIPGFTRRHVDFVTNIDTEIRSHGAIDFFGFVGANIANSYVAVAFPADDIAAADNGRGFAIHAGQFYTILFDISVVPRFGEAMLTTCEVSGETASIDLDNPLRRREVFIGQDNDFAPFYFHRPVQLGRQVLRGIDRGEISHLCLVLQFPPEPFPGVTGFPPLIALDGGIDVPIAGLSFSSPDGNEFTVNNNFNFMFSLVVSDAY